MTRQGPPRLPTLDDMDDGLNRIVDLPDDDTRETETYARFGIAVYHAQLFESGMVSFIAAMTALATTQGLFMTRLELDELIDDLFGHTGGKLVKLLEVVIPERRDDLDICRRAVLERNRLEHHFFRDHAEDFVTASGMQRMVDDADQASVLFGQAYHAVSNITRRIVRVDEQQIQAAVDDLVATLRRADHEDEIGLA